MSNILDYLENRGNVLFSDDPFNEVDSLAFSIAAYIPLDGIVKEGERMLPSAAIEAFWGQHSKEEVAQDHRLYKDSPFILEKIGESPRFKGLEIANYLNIIDSEKEAQISATCYYLPDFTYVAFRGTDNSLVGWKEDFTLSFLPETMGQRMAVEYLNKYFSGTDERLFVGGHSKGGNFAVYASAFCTPGVRDRIEKVFSNDGPGFRNEVTDSAEYAGVLDKVVSILPEDTLVGTLFNGRYKHKIVKSSVEGLASHDATTWQIEGNSFVEVPERSEDSIWLDEVLTDWLSVLSDKDKFFFTDILFDLLSETGATTLDDLEEGPFGKFPEFLMNMHSLPKEKRDEFTRIIKIFTQIFRDNLSKSYLKSWGYTV